MMKQVHSNHKTCRDKMFVVLIVFYVGHIGSCFIIVHDLPTVNV